MLLLGDLTFPESAALRVQVVQGHVQTLVKMAQPQDTSFATGRAPVQTKHPPFSVPRVSLSVRASDHFRPLSITWSRNIGRLVAITTQEEEKKKSASS